ncbi:MAG: hypothetical protein R3D00_20480 [Bacteroidia bacterium]
MDIKKFSLATLAGAVAIFFLAYLFYEPLLGSFFEAHGTNPTAREMPLMLLLVVASLIWAALYTLIFMRWAGISTFMGGLKAGAIIGGLIGLSMNLEFFALNTNMDYLSVIVDTIVWVLRFGLAGGAIGWVLGRGNS